jgi:hypothetical protein
MKPFRAILMLVGLVGSGACERAKSPPPVETATARPLSPADSAVVANTRNWDPGAGPVLLVASTTPAEALVIAPDSANATSQLASIPRPASVTLFGRNGSVQTADLASVVATNICATGRLSAAPPPRPWSVGFVGGVVAPIPMDSTESLSPADSLQFVVGVTRLASALPNDTAGRFVGLPFVVRNLWRFPLTGGRIVVIATLSRQINQEATPLQEHTFLIAERPANDTTLTTAYTERSYGAEETIESSEVLAAAMIGSGRTPALILSRDYGDATAYGLIERGDDGRWRPRWRSARRHC